MCDLQLLCASGVAHSPQRKELVCGKDNITFFNKRVKKYVI
jgi:hypothetical protein